MLSDYDKSQRFYKRIVGAGFLCACAYVLAHMANAVVADFLVLPIERYQPHNREITSERSRHDGVAKQFVQDILESGLFMLPPPAPPPESSSKVVLGGQHLPPMNVESKVMLVGVVMGTGPDGRAILENVQTKEQTLYRVSQYIPDVGKMVAITKDRVLFRDGMREEWLDLLISKRTLTAGGFPVPHQDLQAVLPTTVLAPPQPSRRRIDRALLARLASDPQAYLTEARFQPHFSGDGHLDGFRIDGIRQVGVMEKTGLQNDDVLVKVNGVQIRDPGKLWELFQQLQYERNVRLSLVRQGQPITMTVDIVG